MLRGNQLSNKFLDECSPKVIAAIVKTVKNAYVSSVYSVKQHFREEVQPQAWGYDRWLKIESELLDTCETMGISYEWKNNTENTHIGHIELHFDSFFMTVVRTNTKTSKPNLAKYREGFALSNQGLLFHSDVQPYKNKIWVAIQHVPDVKTGLPQSIRAVFYDREYQHSCNAVDLMGIAHKYETDQRLVELKPVVQVALKDGQS